MGVLSAAARAAMKAKKAAKAAEKAAQKNLGGDTATRGKPKDTPKKAEADRKAAAARAKERNRQENIRTSESKSSINKSRNVSKADIMAANTAAQFRTMQNRIDSMNDGNSKTMMQNLLDRQKDKFKKEQSAELDTMTRKQQQSASDRKPFKGYTPVSPFNRGGMAKRKNYKDGGYANCGASMKPTQGKK
jgi:pyruvate/2-oxoglutarate dehydrogenase complex dihydrolipoamide acyltransferase (E2) component